LEIFNGSQWQTEGYLVSKLR